MEATVLYKLIPEVIYLHFCRILLVTQANNPGTMWEETSQGRGTDQEAEVTRASFSRLATPKVSSYVSQ